MYAKKNSGKKILVTLLALVLVIGASVGGTIAWLMDTSNSVTNTFTIGDIAIEMKEHSLVNGSLSADEVEANIENTYKILPGTTQPKDPFVRFTKDSEACWLFVKIDETNNAVSGRNYKYVTYAPVDSWTRVPGETNVYYMDLTGTGIAANKTYPVLERVSYDQNLTKEELAIAATNKPVLTFTAYAVQKEAVQNVTGDKATAAWNLVKDNPVG